MYAKRKEDKVKIIFLVFTAVVVAVAGSIFSSVLFYGDNILLHFPIFFPH